MEYKDYYKVLEVERSATADEIKKSYRKLARKYHPDVSKVKNAEDKFKDVQEAYEVLKDPDKRKSYDQLGSNWKMGQEFRPPPEWGNRYHHGESSGGTGGFEDDLGGFSDFFSQLFGAGGRRGGGNTGFNQEGFGGFKRQGADQNAKISITLDEAFRGTSKTFQLQSMERDAAGRAHPNTRTIKVSIPAGATSGQQLRLAKQGNAGTGGGNAGDLYLEIEVSPHPYFTIEGKDIYLNVPITPWEAALGADVTIPTLAGSVGLKIAPGTTAGQKLRLKGRGMPGKPLAGDQYAVIQIVTPPATTDEHRELYKKMASVMPLNPRNY